jgi:hypothetical protein
MSNNELNVSVKIQDFIRNLLAKNGPLELSSENSIDSLYESVVSSKWRRSAVDEKSQNDIYRKLVEFKRLNVPIEFSIPFGGYKSWHEPYAPGLNWAEVFWIAFLVYHGRRIAKKYPPGVIYSLSYTSSVMDLVSNLLPEWSSKYISELNCILSYFSDEKVNFRIVDIAQLYGGGGPIREELLKKFNQFEKTWNLSEEQKNAKIASARRNLCPLGLLDLTSLSPNEYEAYVFRSAMMCDALDSLERRREFNKYSTRIQLVHVRGPIPSLHIASCSTSCFHPWVGTGIAEFVESKAIVRDRICSVRSKNTEMLFDEFPLGMEIPWEYKGLKSIRVIYQ